MTLDAALLTGGVWLITLMLAFRHGFRQSDAAYREGYTTALDHAMEEPIVMKYTPVMQRLQALKRTAKNEGKK